MASQTDFACSFGWRAGDDEDENFLVIVEVD